MSGKGLLIATLGGVAAAALITNYFGSESGKRVLDSTKGSLKDLADRANDYVRNSLHRKTTDQASVQTSQPA